LPPEPPIYIAEDDLLVKFDPPPEPAKDGDKAPAKTDQKKEAEAPKKVDAPKKN
jgi:hypothetical protein